MRKAGAVGTGSEMRKNAVAAVTTRKSALSKDTVVGEGIKKKYLKTRDVCKVTFTLPGIAANDAENVCIVGDFNNWDVGSNPMRKLKNGDYRTDVHLYPGTEYQFRYLIDGSRWENDWNADRYVKTPFGDSDNSVIVL